MLKILQIFWDISPIFTSTAAHVGLPAMVELGGYYVNEDVSKY
jgi:hypothetical protein